MCIGSGVCRFTVFEFFKGGSSFIAIVRFRVVLLVVG